MGQLKKLFERPDISVCTAEWDYDDGKFMVVRQVFVKTYNDSFHFYVLPEERRTKNLQSRESNLFHLYCKHPESIQAHNFSSSHQPPQYGLKKILGSEHCSRLHCPHMALHQAKIHSGW